MRCVHVLLSLLVCLVHLSGVVSPLERGRRRHRRLVARPRRRRDWRRRRKRLCLRVGCCCLCSSLVRVVVDVVVVVVAPSLLWMLLPLTYVTLSPLLQSLLPPLPPHFGNVYLDSIKISSVITRGECIAFFPPAHPLPCAHHPTTANRLTNQVRVIPHTLGVQTYPGQAPCVPVSFTPLVIFEAEP